MACRRPIMLAVLLVILVLVPTDTFAAKDYRAERFDVKLVVEPGGAMVVTERIRFVFGDDTFTYVYRGLPSRRTDGVAVLDVAMDGRPFVPGDDPWQFELDRKDNQRRVVWHFPEVRGSAHTFELTYRVSGIVRFEAAEDLLEWYALPTAHTYGIDCASIELHVPAGTALLEQPLVDPPSQSRRGERPLRFERCGFAKNDSWLLRARFAQRSLVTAPTDWQRRAAKASRYLPVFLGLGGMILLAGVFGFVVFGLNHRSSVQHDAGQRRAEPPDALPASLGSALAQSGTATWPSALATLFDLASRRIVRIEEVEGGSIFRKRDFVVKPGTMSASLRPSERALYDLLFIGKSGPRTSLKFSELASIVTSGRRWKTFTSAVRGELRQHGFFDEARKRTRNVTTAAGAFTAVAGLGLLLAAVPFLDEYGHATLFIGIATGVAGLVGLAVGQSLTPLTDEALRRKGRWQAYGRHLKDLAKAPSAGAYATGEAFAAVLPAAVAFGAAEAWAKALEKSGVTVGPAWLKTLPDRGHPMAATVAMISAGHSAGGQAGHGGAGAAGAAGGGSSGAG